MKRIMMIILAACLAAGVLAGCAVKRTGVLLAPGPVALEPIQPEVAPPEVQAKVTELQQKKRPDSTAIVLGDFTYLIVFGGEQKGEGHKVVFLKVESNGELVNVTAQVTEPGPNPSSELNYPVGVARIPRHDGQIAFDVWTVAAPTPLAPK